MSKIYKFEYKIRLDDLDGQGHVGNANWLILLERARIDLCELIGYSYKNMVNTGLMGVVAKANLKYYFQAYMDDVITLEIRLKDPTEKSFVIYHKCRNQDNKLCLVADIKLFFVDPNGKPSLLPKKFNDLFTNLL
ncbi:MAG: YbgC/YbaW family acyl-CoA thioester hydrolase [Francisellaceae bacterium]|jgi:YbgC/YbaW family acyl-CoA thioester hydrolase